jgi:hypothetical protein
MGTRDIKLVAGMGPAILKHLSMFGRIPRKGILAGQAVDSAITDLWGGGGGVYNDIDIFRSCPRDGDNRTSRVNQTAMRVNLELRTTNSYGEMSQILATVASYGIASVSRADMFNYVNCYMADGRMSEKLSANRVISGFDLNCVRVGIDLETQKLYWDASYAEFLRSRQLKITMMHTPWHTFVRLAKKSEELPGVYADMDLAAEACSALAHSAFIGSMVKSKDLSLRFGSKLHGLADAHSRAWAPYFRLEGTQYLKLDSQGLRALSTRPLRQCTPSHVRDGTWYQVQDDEPLLLSARPDDKYQLWQLQSKSPANDEVQRHINLMGKGALFFANRVVEESRRQKKDKVYVKLDTLIRHRNESGTPAARERVLTHAVILGTAYVEGQALPSLSDKVQAFFTKHSNFSNILMGLTLAQQWSAINRIQEVCKRYAQQFPKYDTDSCLGVLETQMCSLDVHDEEALWELLERDRVQNATPFVVEPLWIPAMPPVFADYQVSELLTPLELQQEGRQMHHCVGGYANAIRSGRSRIIRIRGPHSKAWSTVELRRGAEGYDVAQHRAVFNRDPAPRNKLVLAYMLRALKVPVSKRSRIGSAAFRQWALTQERVALRKLDRVSARPDHPAEGTSSKVLLKAAEKDLVQARVMLSLQKEWDMEIPASET